MNFNALKASLINNGLLPPGSTDDQARMAIQSLQANDPNTLAQVMDQAQTFPWLTVIGLGAGALAVYLVWDHYSSTKKLGEIEQPDPEDTRHRLRGFNKSLSRFQSSGGGCKALGRGRLGGADDYEFEPENRLAGLRSKHFRKGARR